MHDVRNQVYSLVQSIKHLREFNIDQDKNCVEGSQNEINSENLELNTKNQNNLSSNIVGINSENFKDQKNIKINDNSSKLKDYELNIQSKMRNQIQSIYENSDTIRKNKRSQKINLKDREKLVKIEKSQDQYLDLNISFDNESILNDQIESNNLINSDITDFDLENKDKIQLNKYNKEISELVKYSKNPIELLNIIKFINQKINFLQHVELTFEYNQKIKNFSTNPSEILNQISKCMKILFINKKNVIILILESNIEQIKIDIFMLKYLVCQLSLQMHLQNYNINIVLKFEHNNKDEKSSQILNLSINGIKQKDQIQKLDNSRIFENLVNNLSQNVNQTQLFIESENIHQIKIILYPQSLNSLEIPTNFQFYEKILIKNDAAEQIHSANGIFIQDNKQIVINNQLVFINVDDEINIQSMHTLLFKKRGISLICCATERELKAIFMQVYAQFNLENKPKIVILLDNVLDNCTGLELYQNLKYILQRFNLEVEWILLSSTEDQNTIKKQQYENINLIIEKPLTILKLDNLSNNINQVDISKE